MDSRDPSFGQNGSGRVLPITTHETDNSVTSQNVPGSLTQPQTLSAEQFHLVDQNGQPIQYELQSLGDSNAQMVSIFYKQFCATCKCIFVLVLLEYLTFFDVIDLYCFKKYFFHNIFF